MGYKDYETICSEIVVTEYVNFIHFEVNATIFRKRRV